VKFHHRRQFLCLAAGAAALPAVSRMARAQAYPARPVTMVVPYPPGAGVDVLGRILAPRLSEHLGQQVIIENIGGTGGMAGSARVARAVPDGYAFVLGNTGTHAQNQTLYKNPPYNAATDFAPVVLIAETPQVLAARRDLPADKLSDFIAHAKVNQAKMQYGSAGAGSPGHLTCALFNVATGINVTHIPYRGAAPALQDLIAGRIDYLCTIAATVIPQFESGTIKLIAVLSRDRSPSMPELGSAHEQGLTEFDASTWQGFFMPKGTPQPIVQKLHDATTSLKYGHGCGRPATIQLRPNGSPPNICRRLFSARSRSGLNRSRRLAFPRTKLRRKGKAAFHKHRSAIPAQFAAAHFGRSWAPWDAGPAVLNLRRFRGAAAIGAGWLPGVKPFF
jgi:tripartite-type tricarboxylate transporter receptor subunit TctC